MKLLWHVNCANSDADNECCKHDMTQKLCDSDLYSFFQSSNCPFDGSWLCCSLASIFFVDVSILYLSSLLQSLSILCLNSDCWKFIVTNTSTLLKCGCEAQNQRVLKDIIFAESRNLRTSPRNVQVILEMARYSPTSNFACWKVFMSK